MFSYLQSYRPNIRHLTVVTLFCLLTLLAPSGLAFAQGNLAVSLFPALSSASAKEHYFVYNSPLGTGIEDSVRVINLSDEPLELYLYPADAVTASEGGAAFSTNFGEPPTREGAWLTLSESRVTLEAKEERRIPFTLNVPPDATAGEHAAFIVAQPADTNDNQQNSPGVGINLVPRVAVAVWTTIPGATEAKMEISSLTAGESSRRHIVVANFRNTGNVGLKGEGKLTIRDPQNGSTVYEGSMRMAYFLAGDSLDYYINLREALPAGEYEAHLSLTHQAGTVEWTQNISLPELKAVAPLPTADENGQMITQPKPVVEQTFPIEWLIAGAVAIVLVLFLLIIIVWRQLKHSQQAMAYSQQGANTSR